MKTNIARVCQIGTTNYVDYKGERLTVEEYNLKYKRNIRIPKDVKICMPTKKEKSYERLGELLAENYLSRHGSRTKKCLCACHDNVLKSPYGHDEKCCESMNGYIEHDINIEKEWNSYEDDIDIPKNLRRVEKCGIENCLVCDRASTPVVIKRIAIFIILILLASLIIHSLK